MRVVEAILRAGAKSYLKKATRLQRKGLSSTEKILASKCEQIVEVIDRAKEERREQIREHKEKIGDRSGAPG